MINKVDIPADLGLEYDTAISFPKVTRVEVIGNGREYVKYGVCNVWASVQDDGRTVKIFTEYDVDKGASTMQPISAFADVDVDLDDFLFSKDDD